MRKVDLPITLAGSLLLDVLWVRVHVPGFGEITREMLFGTGSAIGKTDMVTSVGFV